jgi:hypothetical protein
MLNARIWRGSVSDNVIGRTSSRPVYLVICIVFTLSSCCGRLRLHISSRTLSIFLFCAHNRYRSSYLRVLSIYKFDTSSHLVSIVRKSYSIVALCSFSQLLHILLCRCYFQRNFWHLLSIYQEQTVALVLFGTNRTPLFTSKISLKWRLSATGPISCEKFNYC